MFGSTIVRAEIWSVFELVFPPWVISLTAVVTPNEVASSSGSPPSVASMCSSSGCQSAAYFISNFSIVIAAGEVSWPVAVMIQLPPDRATFTRSLPACRPPMNTRNSAGPTGFCTCGAWALRATAPSAAHRTTAVEWRRESIY